MEDLEDLYIGLDALRVDFARVADELKAGKWGSVIVLRYNKPVGVMVSFDAYRKFKALAESPMPEIAAYLAPALSASATISNEGLITTPAVPIVAPEPEEKS